MPKISDLLDASTLAGDEYVYVLQSGQDRRSTVANLLSGLAGFGGDITGVTAGAGLTGGGTSGTVTLNVSFGSVAGTVASGADARLIGALQTTGGTMTGALTLSGAPSAPLHAATKAYVDSASGGGGAGTITGVTAGTGLTGGGTSGAVTLAVNFGTVSGTAAQGNDSRIVNALPTTGGTMTGLLTLSGAPSSSLHAATKAYVDTSVGSAGGGTITGVTAGTGLSGGGSAGTVTLTVSYGTVSGTAVQGNDTRVVNAVNRTGDTMSGLLTLSGAPTVPLHAATKAYVDSSVGSAGGGTITGVTAGTGLTGGGTTGTVSLAVSYGTTAGTAAQGNDSRITGALQDAASDGTTYGRRNGAWASILGAVLTGLSTATNAAVAATDSALSALGKLQAQITALLSITPPSVKSYGVTGDGTTDDTANMQAALNANAGRTVFIPNGTYKLVSNVTMPAQRVNFQCDAYVYFTGAGRMPGTLSNIDQLFTGTGYTLSPKNGKFNVGDTTMTLEVLPDTNYIGNAVGLYAGAFTPLNQPFAGFVWAANFLTTLNVGTLTGNGVVVEFDLCNFNKDGVGQGVLITSASTFHPQVALCVQTGAGLDWQMGAQIRNFQQGLVIDGSTSAAPDRGLLIEGMTQNLLQIMPSQAAAATATCFLVARWDNAQANLQMTTRGGIIIGPAGTEVRQFLSFARSINSGTINANSSADFFLTCAGAAIGDTCIATPPLSLSNGIVWSAFCATNDQVVLRLANVTTAGVEPDGPGGSTWRIEVIQH